jgi:hypothetical protein
MNWKIWKNNIARRLAVKWLQLWGIPWRSKVRILRLHALQRARHCDAYVRANPRRSALGVTGLVVLGIGASFIDWSSRLSPDQVAIVRTFVIRTNAPPVREVFNGFVMNGYLTVNDAKEILDVAKAQSPGYGLISDQKK